MDETLNRIIELLDKSGMKKIEFLTKLGLSRSAWGAWTSGRMQSYKKMLPEIADIFGVSLDWLSGNEQKNKPTVSDGLTQNDIEFLEKIKKLTAANLELANDQIDALLAFQEKQGK